MKIQVTFSFGVGFRGNGDAILYHERYDGLAEICRCAATLFGGYTKVATKGAWRDSDTNQIVTEAGFNISVLVDEEWGLDQNITKMVQQIKTSLQQKAVAVTRTEVQFDIL